MKMGHCDAANLDPLHGEKGRMLTLKTLLADKKVHLIYLITILYIQPYDCTVS